MTASQDNPEDGDMVRCLFEDREGDLWIGANGGLSRWRNDIFMVYGKPEGLPSDAPNAVFQDSTRPRLGGLQRFRDDAVRRAGIAPLHHARRAAGQRDLSRSARRATAIC